MTSIKLLSDSVHETVLGYAPRTLTRQEINTSRDLLEPFNLEKAEDGNKIVNLPLPAWLGHYQTHLDEAVSRYGSPWLDRLRSLATAEGFELPRFRPLNRPGWQVYRDRRWHLCDMPPDGLTTVLDSETVEIRPGVWAIVCLVALDLSGDWYVWLCDWNVGTKTETYTEEDEETGELKELTVVTYDLATKIDFSENCLIVGHNIPYDRQWLATEYSLDKPRNRFIDTMAMWIACRGMSNQQRAAYAAFDQDSGYASWTDETTRNGLDDVYHFYTGVSLDKGVRDAIVKQGASWVSQNMPDVVWYCIKDVFSTWEVLSAVYPEWVRTQPSLVSQTGQLILGNTIAPLSVDRYPGYYDRCEQKYGEVKAQVLDTILDRLNDLYRDLIAPLIKTLADVKHTSEKWDHLVSEYIETLPGDLQVLDWTPAKTGANKGLPAWYRDLMSKKRLNKLTAKVKTIPILLGCTWKGARLYQKPTGDRAKNGAVIWGWFSDEWGYVPHPEKKGKPVTDLFAKGFIKAIEDSILSAPVGLDAIKAIATGINWVQFRKRARSLHVEYVAGVPLCLPQICVTGTATRRATDNVFQVLANPKPKRIGTEFKSLIEAPSGYSIVGADWDSEELWLASLLGDRSYGFCGSTPLAVTVLIGTKESGTDAHTKVATKLSVDRDIAKILNFATLYGQGLKGACDVLLKALLHLTLDEANDIATNFIRLFKGVKSKHTGRYIGGLASEAFNDMEAIAFSKLPRTPLLEASIPYPLRETRGDYATTKVNWTIQSFGVDIRDMVIVLTELFFDKLGVTGRLMLTIHDEFRYICLKHQTGKAAYALQLAHLCVVAACIDKLGLNGIPAGVAWFSAIDVDLVLRKEPNFPCVTPSQTDAIAPGYKLSPSQLEEMLSRS